MYTIAAFCLFPTYSEKSFSPEVSSVQWPSNVYEVRTRLVNVISRMDKLLFYALQCPVNATAITYICTCMYTTNENDHSAITKLDNVKVIGTPPPAAFMRELQVNTLSLKPSTGKTAGRVWISRDKRHGS